MANVLKKYVLAALYFDATNDESRKLKVSMNAATAKAHVDVMLGMLTEYQLSGATVRLPRIGSLVVRYKKEREGRNPKNKSSAPISARYVSTLVRKNISHHNLVCSRRVNASDFKAELGERLENKKLGKLLLDLFFKSIEGVRDGVYERAEFRGFGSFYTVKHEKGKARNPRTGESVIKESSVAIHYKMSKTTKDTLIDMAKEKRLAEA